MKSQPVPVVRLARQSKRKGVGHFALLGPRRLSRAPRSVGGRVPPAATSLAWQLSCFHVSPKFISGSCLPPAGRRAKFTAASKGRALPVEVHWQAPHSRHPHLVGSPGVGVPGSPIAMPPLVLWQARAAATATNHTASRAGGSSRASTAPTSTGLGVCAYRKSQPDPPAVSVDTTHWPARNTCCEDH